MAINVPSPHSQLWRWEIERLLSGSTGGSGGISGTVIASDTPPANPSLNQLWWETDSGALYIWYNDGDSSQWVMITSSAIIGDLNMQGFKILNTTGVGFPATVVLSPNVNTLDDYREGTFTPSFQGSTVAGVMTYNTRQGLYTKIGNLINLTINMQANAISTAPTGNLAVTGLPPFPLTAGGNWAAGTVGYSNLSPASITGYGCMIDPGYPIASTMQLRLTYATSGGGLQTVMPASACVGGSYLMASVTYRTDV